MVFTLRCIKSVFHTFNSHTVNSEIFVNSVKRHICHVKNLPLWHDLPTSVKEKDFSYFAKKRFFVISRGFYFRETPHTQSFAKIKPS